MDKTLFNKLVDELTVPVKLKALRDGTGPSPDEYKPVAKPQVIQCEYCPKQIKGQVLTAKVIYPNNPIRRHIKLECSCGKILNGKAKGTTRKQGVKSPTQAEYYDPANWHLPKRYIPKP